MFQESDALVDHVIHVSARLLELFLRDHLFYPPRIQVDEITRAAAKVGQVFDGQEGITQRGAKAGWRAELSRPGRAELFMVELGLEQRCGIGGQVFFVLLQEADQEIAIELA